MVFIEKARMALILLYRAGMNSTRFLSIASSRLRPAFCVPISQNQHRISFADGRYVLVTKEVVP
jgi:hypothetical protein